MYTPKFEYFRAGSVDEAVNLLGEHQEAALLAGGHSLIPLMKLRQAAPGALIDIGRINALKGISNAGGTVRIGALTTHAEVASSKEVPSALSEAAGFVGDIQVRNKGTIGGNIAHADPAADIPPVLVALDAKVHAQGPNGSRTISASDFFKGFFETALEKNEVLTAIEVPPQGAGTGSGYANMENPASGYPMVGAAAVITLENGKCASASVVLGGLTPKPTKAPSVEAALVGKELNSENIATAAEAVQGDLNEDEILDDIHASAKYRKAMATVYVKRAVTKAVERAGG